MSRTGFYALLAAVCVVTMPEIAMAQPVGGGTVSGNGTVTLRPNPTAVRVEIPLAAYGPTLKLALQRLKSRREAVAAALEEMKADKQTISFSRPSVLTTGPGGAGTVPGYMQPEPYRPGSTFPGDPGPVLPPPTFVPGDGELVPTMPEPAPAIPPAFAPTTSTTPEAVPPAAAPLLPVMARKPVVEPQSALVPASAGPANAARIPTAEPPPAATFPAIGAGQGAISGAAIGPATLEPAPATPAPASSIRPAGKEVCTAMIVITAQWPLNVETPEEALVAGERIRKAVFAADKDGLKVIGKLSATELELINQSRGPMAAQPSATLGAPDVFFGRTPVQPVVPYGPSTGLVGISFHYVAAISPQQRKAALAEAFAKAKAQAAEVAEAAGGKLGPIKSINGQATMPMPPGISDDQNEVHAPEPAGLEIRVNVYAQFHLQ